MLALVNRFVHGRVPTAVQSPGDFGPVVKEKMSLKVFLFSTLVAILFSRAERLVQI